MVIILGQARADRGDPGVLETAWQPPVICVRGNMNQNFDKCMTTLLAHEGGYVNYPSDPGG